MKLWDLIKIANRNLFRAKLRTFLTVMAIFIGSFTLTLTNGLGGGLRDYVNNQVKNIEGNNVLFVHKKMPVREDDNAKPDEPKEYKEASKDEAGNTFDPDSVIVSLAQAENLAREFPEVKNVTPSYRVDGEYITLDGAKKYHIELGMLSEGVKQKTEAGKTIDGEKQIMLPVSLAKAFDENISRLIGKTATIGYKTAEKETVKTIALEIVGISTKGMMANYNCFVDAKTARQIYDDQQNQKPDYNKFFSYTFLLNTKDHSQIAETKKKLDEKGFAAETFADREKRTYDAIGILQIGLNFFAFIALLAASFGIINTLVIAVLERTKEVGLQKALGMGRAKIFLLFSLESVLIGFWGAVTGILSAIVTGKIANFFLAKTYLESFEGYSLFVFTPLAIIFVLLLVCAIAFLAGVLPAFRASRLNPIEALRYE
ncbi:MAG TPA: FtsX-like permease family protein [Pyrinomonadaceae bacterium]|nr:FtsX-like permease family protein [Pyrinomonadaceae bacterium]